ncbi:hypothetical protein DCC85_22560 [Paenibacillus sp. CAA11]|uniref:hypothetical protein n=1 Tax=Paenibacillus sp. CAA11 TaxID=1532905 RepID=UPI000D3576CF|nr:hypothetical protein [Paenibacillus sp. CAA11]AWB46677.1 hypothetical protein DCC85_22560 [Paenibacillus sp. CAA11]
MADKQVIALTCPTCGHVSERVKMESELFDLVGFDEIMEWSEYEEEVPALEEDHWMRSDEAPVKGALRTVKIKHPFHMTVGERFWILYTPVMSSLNGWDSHPEEIEKSAFVQCAIERVLAEGKSQAWVSVSIHEVLPLGMFSDLFAARDGSRGYLDAFDMFGKPSFYAYQEWLWMHAGAQGDLGVWGLVKIIDGEYYLLVYGDWDHHTNNVYGGNILLPRLKIEAWIQQAREGNRYESADSV